MLIVNDRNESIIIDNICTPIQTDSFWTLDLGQMDFTLAPIVILEEVVCATVSLTIRGFSFQLPGNWNILVYDEETMQLDVVEVGDLAGKDFTAFVYGPNASRVVPGRITLTDYTPAAPNSYPSLNKHQMLCHPISPTEWIVAAPSDSYNKYIKNKSVGDIT